MNINSLLNFSLFYKTFSRLAGANKFYSIYVNDYIKPKDGSRILDIGCGAADILNFLPAVEYIGIDMNDNYIQSAIRKYRDKGLFLCKTIGKDTLNFNSKFDIIMANGVLHHLNDEEAIALYKLAAHCISSTGRVITIDPCFEANQSKLVKFIISQDRGKFVRTRDDFLKLSSRFFSSTATIRHNLINLPYTHIIMECYNPTI